MFLMHAKDSIYDKWIANSNKKKVRKGKTRKDRFLESRKPKKTQMPPNTSLGDSSKKQNITFNYLVGHYSTFLPPLPCYSLAGIQKKHTPFAVQRVDTAQLKIISFISHLSSNQLTPPQSSSHFLVSGFSIGKHSATSLCKYIVLQRPYISYKLGLD